MINILLDSYVRYLVTINIKIKMDIGRGCGYPASSLSNFAPHPFVIDGVECASMEGFLQSLKFASPDIQVEVCKLVGYAAKKRGASKNWRESQTLWWRGVAYDRKGKNYQNLLDRAYEELSKNEGFRSALLATRDSNLTHSIGKSKKNDTILTRSEFCSRLMKLRDKIKSENETK